MAGMFPTFVSDPNDPNRRGKIELGDEWPTNLRISFYLLCAASVVMIVLGLILLSNGFPGDPANADLRRYYMTNMRITAYGNILLAVALTSAAAFFKQGSRRARLSAAGFTALAMFLNVIAFLIRIAPVMAMIPVALLAFAMLFAFRRDSNAFIERESPKY